MVSKDVTQEYTDLTCPSPFALSLSELIRFAEDRNLEYEVEGEEGYETVTFIRRRPLRFLCQCPFVGKSFCQVERERITLPRSIEWFPAIGLDGVPIPSIKGLPERLARELIGYFLSDHIQWILSLEFSKRQPELPTRAIALDPDNLDPLVVR